MSERNPALASYPAVTFSRAQVAPASALYITAEEFLIVTHWNSVVGSNLEIRWRLMRADGVVLTAHQSVPMTSGRSPTVRFYPLCEGFLMGVTLSVTGNPSVRGNTFAQVAIGRGTQANPDIGEVLISDYPTTLVPVSWPGGILHSPLDGKGWTHTVETNQPIVGAEYNIAVPANTRWRLIGFHALFTASAVVATRTPALIVNDGVFTFLKVPAQQNTTAGQANQHYFSPLSFAPAAPPGDIHSPFWTDVYALAGWTIRTVTLNLDVGDQYSQVALFVEEWFDI